MLLLPLNLHGLLRAMPNDPEGNTSSLSISSMYFVHFPFFAINGIVLWGSNLSYSLVRASFTSIWKFPYITSLRDSMNLYGSLVSSFVAKTANFSLEIPFMEAQKLWNVSKHTLKLVDGRTDSRWTIVLTNWTFYQTKTEWKACVGMPAPAEILR